MAEKFEEKAVIIRQEEIADDIYSMWLKTDRIAGAAKPGQFISVYSNDGSRLLPRPISICEIHDRDQALRLVYRIAGKGTEEFSHMKTGGTLKILGPLGNGFPLAAATGRHVCLMGGGIGIPPMLALAEALEEQKEIVLGFRDELFLMEDFAGKGEISVATEDGSAGVKGNVLDILKNQDMQMDVIFACGPKPMLKAVKQYAIEHDIECYISMEERMACGVGACLGCVCQSKEVDSHSHVHNKRVCKDGPVFNAREVEL